MVYDFCGIGNACVDIVACVEDSFLEQWEFQKGICTYLLLEPANDLEKSLISPSYIPGGCSANTASVVTALGGSASFIGRVADDPIGHIFLQDMKDRNIRYTGIPDTQEGAGSTRIFAMTTPDTERTFAAFYGVQEDLSEKDLDRDALEQSRFLYLDGYALNSNKGRETFLQAANIAKAAGQQVVFSPSDLSILTKYPDTVKALIAVSDGIVCNTSEALFLTQKDTIEDAVSALRDIFAFGAITCGENGACVFDKASTDTVAAAKPPAPVLDTNGAGDAFAGGFLFGLARGWPLPKAAALGNLCAAVIITHYGARPIGDYQPLIAQVSQ